MKWLIDNMARSLAFTWAVILVWMSVVVWIAVQ